jgi:hypothetical protein
VAPIEEDSGIAGRHLIGKANRAAIRELQGQRREPVILLQLLAHVSGSSNCRALARFLTGSALGLGVLAKTLPGRQALDGYAAVVVSVLGGSHVRAGQHPLDRLI